MTPPTPPALRQIPLAARAVYQVREGVLDVFAVSDEDAAAPWQRRHLLQVQAGDVAFGLDLGPYRRSLLGVRGVGTEIHALSPEALEEGEAADPGRSLRLLDPWIVALLDAIRPTDAPRNRVAFGPGTVETDDAVTVQADEGVRWVTITAGQALWCGVVPVPPGGRVPVTPRAWLVLRPDAAQGPGIRVGVETTDQAAGGLGPWPLVALLEALVGAQLDADAAREQHHDAERQLRRVATDRAHYSEALRLVNAVLDPESERRARRSTPEALDPLMAACARVGEHLGVDLTTPVDLPAGAIHSLRVSLLARASGVRTRRVALADQWWTADRGPLVALMEDGTVPVALLPSPAGYQLVRAGAPPVRLTAAQAADVHPFATSFYRPLPPVRLGARDLLRFASREGTRDAAVALALALAGALLALLVPLATSVLVGRVIPSGERAELFFVVAVLVGSAVAQGLFAVAQRLRLLRLSAQLDLVLQAAVFDRLLALPVSFFQAFSSGDLAQRALGITAIRRQIAGAAAGAVLTGSFSVFSFLLLFAYDAPLAMVAGVLVVGLGGLTSAAAIARLHHERGLQSAQGRATGMMLQLVSGIARIRVTGAESRAFAVWARLFTEQRKAALAGGLVSIWMEVAYAAFPALAAGLLFWVARSRGLSPGIFLGFYAAFGQVVASALGLSTALVGVWAVRPAWERLRPILDETPEATTHKSDPGDLTGLIEVHKVRFRYAPDGPLVLDDVSLQVKPGEFIALVGPSGSGKSTLLRILLGFGRPEAGAAYYDGRDLWDLDQQRVRRQLGIVLQAPALMPGDLLGNIVGTTGATIDDAWEAARKVGIEEEIAAMPMKMNTLVGGTSGLSGGQRQRLAIARAIVTRPRILFLDEATSALDNRAQAIVAASLDRLDAARVVVAHRLSTVRSADRIYVLDAGRVVQQGTFEELIGVPGLFQQLAKRQLA